MSAGGTEGGRGRKGRKGRKEGGSREGGRGAAGARCPRLDGGRPAGTGDLAPSILWGELGPLVGPCRAVPSRAGLYRAVPGCTVPPRQRQVTFLRGAAAPGPAPPGVTP